MDEFHHELVVRDIKAFSDSSRRIHASRDNSTLQLEWTLYREKMCARFFEAEDGLAVEFDGRTYSYRDFLACPQIGDALAVATSTISHFSERLYVRTKALVHNDDSAEAVDAVTALSRLADDVSSGTTRLLFVTAEAGAGKTEVLKQFAYEKCLAFANGQSESLALYINAQGRSLARLEEALASELQDLRVRLTYHGVPALARHGIIVLIVDGFDELLATGRDDAFGSIRKLLEDLGGNGTIIASARSTYFEREFLRKESTRSSRDLAVKIVPIHILDWSLDEIKDYGKLVEAKKLAVAHPGKLTETLVELYRCGGDSGLLGKPFFAAKAVDLYALDVNINIDYLVPQLVEAYAHREYSEKILDRDGQPLLNEENILYLARLVEEEMWYLETRSLDPDSLEEITRLYCEDASLTDEVERILVDRVAVMAFFRPSERVGYIEFEHDILFNFFLAQSIQDALRSTKTDLFYRIVERSRLSFESCVFFASDLDLELASSWLQLLIDANIGTAKRQSVLLENFGGLITALVRRLCEVGSRPSDYVFQGVVFKDIPFHRMTFEDTQFRDATFQGVVFSDVHFERCIFD